MAALYVENIFQCVMMYNIFPWMSRGFVCIITNVASKWGKTPVNYTQLAAMHTKYAEMGLRILGFPCNQFGKQVRFTPALRFLKAQAFCLMWNFFFFFFFNHAFSEDECPCNNDDPSDFGSNQKGVSSNLRMSK